MSDECIVKAVETAALMADPKMIEAMTNLLIAGSLWLFVLVFVVALVCGVARLPKEGVGK